MTDLQSPLPFLLLPARPGTLPAPARDGISSDSPRHGPALRDRRLHRRLRRQMRRDRQFRA